MEVRMDCPDKVKLSLNCRQAVIKLPNTKLSITHSFFELQSPDFAWKFVWKMSSCRQAVINSPAPAINTQKEKKSKKVKKMQKDKKMQKHKKRNMQKEQQNIKFYFRASY